MDEIPSSYSGILACFSFFIRRILYYVFLPIDHFFGKNQEDEISFSQLSRLSIDLAEELIYRYVESDADIRKDSKSIQCFIASSAMEKMKANENFYYKTERAGYPLTVEILEKETDNNTISLSLCISTRKRALNPFAIISSEATIIIFRNKASFDSILTQ